MTRISFLFVGSALGVLIAGYPAVAAQPTLDQRVRVLEQMLGVPPRPNDTRTLEQRVRDLEAFVRERNTAAAAPAATQAATQAATAAVQQAAQATDVRLDKVEMRLDNKDEADAARLTRLSTLEQQFADTVWSFDNSRPQVQSADARFLFALRARIQFDTALFNQDSNLNSTNVQFKDLASGSVVRRFYFGAEGRAFRDFWYEFRMDLGGANTEATNSIVNLARVAYNFGDLAYGNQSHFRINIGIIQPLFTYGDSVSSGSITLFEAADVVNMATGAYGGGDHRHGAELTFQEADLFYPGDNLVLSTAYTGQQTPAPGGVAINTSDEGTQIIGRGVYRFWSDGFSNLQAGANFSKIINLNGATSPGGIRTVALQDRPEVRIDGNRLVSTASSTILGNSIAPANIPMRGGDLWGLEGGGNLRNFFVYGEYMNFGADRDVHCVGCTPFGGLAGINPGDPRFFGWYIEGSWILTGETKTYSPLATNNEYATFNNPRVITPFDPASGNWGAWELAARYSDLDLNWHAGAIGQTALQAPIGGIRGGDERIWSLGLNWYPNNNVLMRFNYLMVDVDKLGFVGSGATATLQQIGQSFTAVGMRLQFSN